MKVVKGPAISVVLGEEATIESWGLDTGDPAFPWHEHDDPNTIVLLEAPPMLSEDKKYQFYATRRYYCTFVIEGVTLQQNVLFSSFITTATICISGTAATFHSVHFSSTVQMYLESRKQQFERISLTWCTFDLKCVMSESFLHVTQLALGGHISKRTLGQGLKDVLRIRPERIEELRVLSMHEIEQVFEYGVVFSSLKKLVLISDTSNVTDGSTLSGHMLCEMFPRLTDISELRNNYPHHWCERGFEYKHDKINPELYIPCNVWYVRTCLDKGICNRTYIFAILRRVFAKDLARFIVEQFIPRFVHRYAGSIDAIAKHARLTRIYASPPGFRQISHAEYMFLSHNLRLWDDSKSNVFHEEILHRRYRGLRSPRAREAYNDLEVARDIEDAIRVSREHFVKKRRLNKKSRK